MPKPKGTPKRRRVEEEEKEKEALEELKKAPTEFVEQAAAEAFSQAVQHWPVVPLDGPLPDWLQGLGKATTVPVNHFQALQSLHALVKQKASGLWSSWSGDPQDPRRRCFGVLPDTLGSNDAVSSQLDISMPWQDHREEERAKNLQATVLLHQLPQGVQPVIDWICLTLRDQLGDPSLAPFLHYSALLAAQPNLHSGRQLLPIHVDHPRKDGFGVLIVTIAILGNATILFQDYTDQNKAKMTLQQGQVYMIASTARDASAHGVLADPDSTQRESLNLRFGLHDLPPNYGYPTIPSSNVLRHWELDSETKTIVEAEKGGSLGCGGDAEKKRKAEEP
jgi:hypothetical protein